jgi:hypothetical protein
LGKGKGGGGFVRIGGLIVRGRVAVIFAIADESFSLSLSLYLMYLLLYFFSENNSCFGSLSSNNRALSPFLSAGGYCPAGSSAVTSCPAGGIDCLL